MFALEKMSFFYYILQRPAIAGRMRKNFDDRANHNRIISEDPLFSEQELM